MKLGLVLEGGSMRGMFTAGVLDVLMENGIRFDGTAGVSAGAVFGCNIKSGQIGRVIRYNKKYCRDKRYSGIGNLIKTGSLFGIDFCYNKIVNELDVFDAKAFRENPMEFYVVCTDAVTGKPVYHLCPNGDARDVMWMRASASLPGASRAVDIDGTKLYDGGISDSVPLRFMQSMGYSKNIVVLTQPRGYTKKPFRAPRLAGLLLHKYPNTVASLKRMTQMYNNTLSYISQQEKTGNAFVISPPETLNIGVTERNPNNLDRVYQLGRKEAEHKLDKILSFCRQAKPTPQTQQKGASQGAV